MSSYPTIVELYRRMTDIIRCEVTEQTITTFSVVSMTEKVPSYSKCYVILIVCRNIRKGFVDIVQYSKS